MTRFCEPSHDCNNLSPIEVPVAVLPRVVRASPVSPEVSGPSARIASSIVGGARSKTGSSVAFFSGAIWKAKPSDDLSLHRNIVLGDSIEKARCVEPSPSSRRLRGEEELESASSPAIRARQDETRSERSPVKTSGHHEDARVPSHGGRSDLVSSKTFFIRSIQEDEMSTVIIDTRPSRSKIPRAVSVSIVSPSMSR
jgi:hypothetical protein